MRGRWLEVVDGHELPMLPPTAEVLEVVLPRCAGAAPGLVGAAPETRNCGTGAGAAAAALAPRLFGPVLCAGVWKDRRGAPVGGATTTLPDDPVETVDTRRVETPRPAAAAAMPAAAEWEPAEDSGEARDEAEVAGTPWDAPPPLRRGGAPAKAPLPLLLLPALGGLSAVVPVAVAAAATAPGTVPGETPPATEGRRPPELPVAAAAPLPPPGSKDCSLARASWSR